MTRFESEDDPGFIAITGELRRWIKEVTKLAATQDRSEEPNQTDRAQTTQCTGFIERKELKMTCTYDGNSDRYIKYSWDEPLDFWKFRLSNRSELWERL